MTGQRHVTLVTGPPCSGKTTWVHHRAQPGDIIIDADDIARRLGSPDRWQHTTAYRDGAQRVAWQQMTTVADMTTGTAYVIRSVPDPTERARLTKWLRADRVVVLLPPAAVLAGRARRRPHAHRTTQAIRWWLTHYHPNPTDEINPQ